MSQATWGALCARVRPVALTATVLAAGACSSTDPSPDPVFRVRGSVSEGGAVPVPPLRVRLRAWPDSTGAGSMEVRTLTDELGSYAATFGTLPGGRADSLQLQLVQADCEDTQRLTTAVYRDLAVPSGEMTLPGVDLNVVLPPAHLGTGRAACALIVHTEEELETWLALWFDEVGDSIIGRWRVNHQASIGDAYGYARGILEGGQLALELEPVEPATCPGLSLTIDVHAGSNRLEAGSLTGNPACSVPSAPVRFADGAYLRELLPPAAGPTHPVGVLGVPLPLTGRPHGVATTASGLVYVSQIDADEVTRGQLGASGLQFSGSAAVGATPAHVAITPDGATAFTANQSAATVSVVDVATNTTTGSIPLSDGGFNLIVSPDGARLYVTTAAGVLHEIDVATGTVLDTLHVGAAANGLTISRDGVYLYVSSIAAAEVTAISTATFSVERTYDVAGMPQRIAVSGDGARLFLASEVEGLSILDLGSGHETLVGAVGPGAVGLALSPDEQVVYLTRPPSNEVVVVDVATQAVVQRFTGLGRPRNVAFGLNGRVALVTGEFGQVYVVE